LGGPAAVVGQGVASSCQRYVPRLTGEEKIPCWKLSCARISFAPKVAPPEAGGMFGDGRQTVSRYDPSAVSVPTVWST
jgi:hypothetical protein